jgi:xylan 1,4-beta-xylosidase
MSPAFTCDLTAPPARLPHSWEHTVGSDHATMALRADWRDQLRRAHDELGFTHVRFHGILSDDMGTLLRERGRLLYQFYNADSVIDFLRSIGMRPFVELSFMPAALASGPTTVFKYQGNVTPPRDYRQWGALITRLVGHWVERYGLAEVRRWFFEVWNEPNLTAFWTGSQAGYFTLYRHTVRAIKAIDSKLKVGGPATADNGWITEFLEYCRSNRLPVDFISTHHYPTDAFGNPGDDTIARLSKSRRSVLRDEARAVHAAADGKPVYYTEWSSSSNPRDALHDMPYAAAFIVKTVLEANGLVEGYSYWTFSDLFEENYLPAEPFQGGFGLLTIRNIAKPAYRAFQLLHAIGTKLRPVLGSHRTVDTWVVSGPARCTIICTNWALPRHAIAAEAVRLTLTHAGEPVAVTIRRVDEHHANARRAWQAMGAPKYPSPQQLRRLHTASQMTPRPQRYRYARGELRIDLAMPAQAVAAVSIRFGNTRNSKEKERWRRT